MVILLVPAARTGIFPDVYIIYLFVNNLQAALFTLGLNNFI